MRDSSARDYVSTAPTTSQAAEVVTTDVKEEDAEEIETAETTIDVMTAEIAVTTEADATETTTGDVMTTETADDPEVEAERMIEIADDPEAEVGMTIDTMDAGIETTEADEMRTDTTAAIETETTEEEETTIDTTAAIEAPAETAPTQVRTPRSAHPREITSTVRKNG